MINPNLCLALSIAILLLLHHHSAITATPVSVPKLLPPLCIACNKTTLVESAAVCVFDERDNCIRHYASKCQLEFAACTSHKTFTDYSAEYCSMRGFICAEVEAFERWTIFFGHEKN